MRLRNRPEAEAFLREHPEYVILEPQKYNGQFSSLFPVKQPLRIEIGMGKGDFMIGMAQKYPEINFIGIEKYDSVLYVALKKILKQTPLPNLKVMCWDATHIQDVFSEGEVDRIYLNFSDPWPKKRHYTRRLTYHDFLVQYQLILKEQGGLELKTDNRTLFEFSLLEMNRFPMTFDDISLDLHHSIQMEDNVMTEYERKFSPNGPIYRLVAHFESRGE